MELGLRDLLFIAVVFAVCGVALVRPFLGFQGFLVFSIVNPHGMAWSIASTFHPVQPIAAATILGYLFSREPKRLPRQGEMYLLLALWAMFGLSTLDAVYPQDASKHLTTVSKVLLMVFLSMALANTRERVVQVLRVIALSLGFLGLKGGVFAVLNGGEYMVWGPEKSFLEANNAMGVALAMNLPLLFYVRRFEERRWLRRVMTVMLLFSYPAIVCTFSRSAWLSAAAASAVIVWSSRFRWTIAVGLLAAVAVVPSMLPERVVNRYHDLTNYEHETSAQSRFWTWEFCRRVGMGNLATGAGFSFPSERTYAQYYPEFLDWRGRVASCHSTWLTVFGEHGVPGLLLWLGLLGSSFLSRHRLRRAARANPDHAWAATVGQMVTAALLAFMVGGTFLDLAYFDIFYQLVALLAVTKAVAGEPAAIAATVSRGQPRSQPAVPLRPRGVLLAVAVLTLLAAPQPAAAQAKDPLLKISANRVMVGMQLTMGVTTLEQAVRVAEGAAGPADIELARDLASEAYVLMRVATHGIELLQDKAAMKNYTDPLLEMCRTKVWNSRMLNLDARRELESALGAGGQASGHLVRAIERLNAALRVGQEAVDLF